jgi:hypothetical protein
MEGKLLPRERNFQKCTCMAETLLLAIRLLATFHLGKYVKTSEATLKGRYTYYARIYIEMNVSGALLEAISLEFKDEEWIQNIDYEQIPFRCRRCHEHGHLIRECPIMKKQETKNTKLQ